MNPKRRSLVCLTAAALMLAAGCKASDAADASPIASATSAVAASPSTPDSPAAPTSAAASTSTPATASTSTAATASTSTSAAAGRSATPTAAVKKKTPAVAPYIDVTSGTTDIGKISAKTGMTDFSLAFILAKSTTACTPTWGGTKALTDSTVQAQVKKIAALGGRIVVSSGGATGTYLESVCTSAQLAKAYTQALNATGSNALDVDIEQTVAPETVAEALAILQAARGTAISLTVPVGGMTVGLTDKSIALLRSVKNAGVEVTVNPMIMNFDASGGWGAAMIAATEAVHTDLKAIWTGRTSAQLYAMLGITPMIGVNDTGPVTTVASAKTLLTYAEQKNLAFIRFWSINRDNGGCTSGSLSGTCSGITQSEYAFTSLFSGYGK
ncbi:glycosyl hydrolase [Actinoplanes sp. CA-054009]